MKTREQLVLAPVMGLFWGLTNAHFSSSVMDRRKKGLRRAESLSFFNENGPRGGVSNDASRRHPPWETPCSSLRRFELHSRDSKLSALFPSPEEAWNGKSENGERKA